MLSTFWRRIGDEFYLPETAHQLNLALIEYERAIFIELHYGRNTYYPLHDRARIDRPGAIYFGVYH